MGRQERRIATHGWSINKWRSGKHLAAPPPTTPSGSTVLVRSLGVGWSSTVQIDEALEWYITACDNLTFRCEIEENIGRRTSITIAVGTPRASFLPVQYQMGASTSPAFIANAVRPQTPRFNHWLFRAFRLPRSYRNRRVIQIMGKQMHHILEWGRLRSVNRKAAGDHALLSAALPTSPVSRPRHSACCQQMMDNCGSSMTMADSPAQDACDRPNMPPALASAGK